MPGFCAHRVKQRDPKLCHWHPTRRGIPRGAASRMERHPARSGISALPRGAPGGAISDAAQYPTRRGHYLRVDGVVRVGWLEAQLNERGERRERGGGAPQARNVRAAAREPRQLGHARCQRKGRSALQWQGGSRGVRGAVRAACCELCAVTGSASGSQSRCRCGRKETSPGADVAGASPVPV